MCRDENEFFEKLLGEEFLRLFLRVLNFGSTNVDFLTTISFLLHHWCKVTGRDVVSVSKDLYEDFVAEQIFHKNMREVIKHLFDAENDEEDDLR